MSETSRKISPGLSGVRLQMNSRLEMLDRFLVLRLRSVDQSQKLMELITIGRVWKKLFELSGRGCKSARIIVGNSRLKLPIQFLILIVFGQGKPYAGQKGTKNHQQKQRSLAHRQPP